MRRFVRGVSPLAFGFVVMNALGFSSLASAQTHRVEVSGGYQALDTPDRTFPTGWYVDVAANVNSWFGVVGEVGSAYKSERQQISINQTVDVKYRRDTFMGGVRLSWRIDPRVVLFHNVLVGRERASRTDAAGVPLSPSETKFALQPNLGVNFMVTDKVGVRMAADFRRVFLGGDRGGLNEYRFTMGVVLPFGKL
jgi:opacity protein-like surface antigen